MRGIQIKTDYKDRKVGGSCDVLFCSSLWDDLRLRGTFIKTMKGDFYFNAGCLDDISSLVTVVLNMRLYPLAPFLISTPVHSGSLRGTLLKV